MKNKYIAYFRVSTDKQGIKGLGIEAQKKIVKDYVKSDESIIAEYIEVESGKKDNRIELEKAINHCQKEKAILVIAKLDRLSRNISFITALMESKLKFICCDMPEANDFTIHIFAALAQQERKYISERTKSALAVLKANGIVLGNPDHLTVEAIAESLRVRKLKAITNPNNVKASGYIKRMRESNLTYKQIADILNEEGFKTSRGQRFNPTQVLRLANR